MFMNIGEIINGKAPYGSKIVVEGNIKDLLPVFKLGDISYDRFILEDRTGRVVVLLPSSTKYYLPGDTVKVVGRVRPCPYAPSSLCIESSDEEVEIRGWKWIDPHFRKELDRMGNFYVRILLQVSTVDDKVIRGILETSLDPMKIKERFEYVLEKGESASYLIETLSSMTMYSIFFRDLEAAKSVKTSIYLVKGLDLPEGIRSSLRILEEMVDSLTSREGLASYVKPPEAVRGVVERYPLAEDKDLKELAGLEWVANRILESLKERKGEFVIIEVKDRTQLVLTRRLAEIVSGISGLKLYYMPVSSVTDTESFLEAVNDLKVISDSIKSGESAVIYLEGLEILLPSDMMLSAMKLPEESVEGAKVFKTEMGGVFERLLQGNSVIIVATSSKALIDDKFSSKATMLISGTTFRDIGSTPKLPY